MNTAMWIGIGICALMLWALWPPSTPPDTSRNYRADKKPKRPTPVQRRLDQTLSRPVPPHKPAGASPPPPSLTHDVAPTIIMAAITIID